MRNLPHCVVSLCVQLRTPRMSSQPLTFEVWKARLREDCERHGKLLPFSKLGEDTLRILYECGTEPSLKGIADGGTAGV